MADPKQLERLTRSVKEWNQWRRQQSHLRPNPNGTSLSTSMTWIDPDTDIISDTDISHASQVHTRMMRISIASQRL